MKRERSVVLLSGGLDSAANLALCAVSDEPLLALTVRYGQRAAEKEVQAAASLCEYFGVKHQVVDIPWLGSLGGNALTDSKQAIPEFIRSQLDEKGKTEESARQVWVPNRNGILIHLAAAYAEVLHCRRVVVGFNSEEAVTFPDNTMEYLARATKALEMSTANHVEVHCYTGNMNKLQIVAELRKLKKTFPFEKIWSCYYGGPQPCTKCESCQRLARALGSL